MGLMSDAAEWCWLLVAHGCREMPIFGQQLAGSLALISKSGPKVMAFVVMNRGSGPKIAKFSNVLYG